MPITEGDSPNGSGIRFTAAASEEALAEIEPLIVVGMREH